MTDKEAKARHDLSKAIRNFAGIIKLIEAKFDFAASGANKVLEEAKQAHAFLEEYLDRDASQIKKQCG